MAFGGNKVRSLDLVVAEALRRGADTLVTGAGPLSNHVRASAAVSALAELRCIAVYWGAAPARAEGNYWLTRMLGAEIRFTGDSDRTSVDRGVEAAVADVVARGGRPYVIPRGGACAVGVLAHVLAVRETLDQCAALGVAPKVVVMAVGGAATLAGARAVIWQKELERTCPMDSTKQKHALTISCAVAAIFGVLLLQQSWNTLRQTEAISYTEFARLVASKKISEAVINSDMIEGTLKEPALDGKNKMVTVRVDPAIADKLAAEGIKVSGAPPAGVVGTILAWIPAIIFYSLAFFLFRKFAGKQLGKRDRASRLFRRARSIRR
jgi:1-aminocyclopropane-1-carboxylate deaminase/D-cysteine desulfhydrase-like pyridoxal-dependent ACC family enzyme